MPDPVQTQTSATETQTAATPEPVGAVGGTVLAGGEPPPTQPEPKPADMPPPLVATDLKLPEGMAPESLGDFLKIASDPAMSAKDRSQALIDLYGTKAKELSEAPLKTFKDLNEQWQKEIMADPEIGGANLEQTKVDAAKVMESLLGPRSGSGQSLSSNDKFRQMLDLTGAGNHPEMARFFSKVAKVLNEGSHVGGNPPNLSQKPKPTAAEAMFPTLAKGT